MTRVNRFAACGVAAAAALLLARNARAQVMCNDATMFPNPTVLTGSSAFEATVDQFAVKLSSSAETTPTQIIYQVPGSCAGVQNFLAGPLPSGATGHYYTLDSTGKVVINSCNFDGTQANVAISDVFYESCGTNVPHPMASTLKDIPGPAQAMLFVVPKANTTTQYITAAEAADIYGCGYTAGIATFNVMGAIFCRDPNSGTQITIAKNIGLDASVIVPPVCTSVGGGTTNGMLGVIGQPTTPVNSTIGFVGADAYDTQRANMNSLAFQAQGQNYAFYSDSGPSTADRQNVRDGHYTIWGYEHMIVKVDTAGNISDAKAANFVGWINGTKTDPNFDYITTEGAAGTIPTCAMKVQRSIDGGLLSPYNPSDPCGCAFEAAITHSSPSECVTCTGTGTSTCTGGKTCHHGYCE
jgi:hypothetical protein